MRTYFFLVILLLVCVAGQAAKVDARHICRLEPRETCTWEMDVRTSKQDGELQIGFRWNKAIQSRHWEKPLASKLVCNVDRDFNPQAGGYVHVWFENRKEPCNPMQTDPSLCGVTFLLEDPTQFHSARGFDVRAPTGETLVRVELYSTLNLQCGDLSTNDYDKLSWATVLGWDKNLGGDGTYKKNEGPK